MRILKLVILAFLMSTAHANIILHGTLDIYDPNKYIYLYDFPSSNEHGLSDPIKQFPAPEYSTSMLKIKNISYDISTLEGDKNLILNKETGYHFAFLAKLIRRSFSYNYFNFELIHDYTDTVYLDVKNSTESRKFKVVKIKFYNKDHLYFDGFYKNMNGKPTIQTNDARFKIKQSDKSPHILNLSMPEPITVTIELAPI